ncbi:helicase domain-containing protein [Candidatus Vecturithrix granuli]|uniref:Helicase domain-containing protein n=1 Tax=Vecturithrix granuli TaxID=1499967 RepID=A0A081BWV0_VECG1|nr:helicase domain-containing protein [Candidatus Vecturithrix granuli]
MKCDELTPYSRIFDAKLNKTRIVLAVETHPTVILLTCKDVDTGKMFERQPFKASDIEQRFKLLEPGPFQARSDIVKLALEGRRLEHAYLFNPLFATETSLIDALPHQLSAVYDHLLPKTRLRFLLADDAGAGKTIVAGLYIREMLLRKLIRRVLIAPPAGLVGNWQAELQKLFRLPFRIIRGNAVKDENPFTQAENDLAIISIDTLWRERIRTLYQDAPPYDLVVFDEAHKLSAHREADFTVRKTGRYEMAEFIARQGRHLLLMTATPHSGKLESYFYLWQLLDPELFSTLSMFQRVAPEIQANYLLRRVKEDMVDFHGARLFPRRESQTIAYDLTPAEQSLYDDVTAYFTVMYAKAERSGSGAARLAMSILQRRLASSTCAIMRSLYRRRQKLHDYLENLKAQRLSEAEFRSQQQAFAITDYREEFTSDEEDTIEQDGERLEEGEWREQQELGATAARTLIDLQLELAEVERLARQAEAVYHRKHESKFEKLWEALQEHQDQPVLIFTEHKDTLDFLIDRLSGKGFGDEIASIHGGMDYSDRLREVARFNRRDAKYMLATDAAGEGLNMQEACWILINYDIPWNPARLEQRLGRIHRYKQRHDVLILNLVAHDTREGKVLKTLLDKLENIRAALGDEVFDVIGAQFRNVSLADIIMQACIAGRVEQAVQQIEDLEDQERIAAILQEQQARVECQAVKSLLEGWNRRLQDAELLRIMPAFIRYYIEELAPYLGLTLAGDIRGLFRFEDTPEFLQPVLLTYPADLRDRLTFEKTLALPSSISPLQAIYLHPGEIVFDRISSRFLAKYSRDAQIGGMFFDKKARQPYLFYLARIAVLKTSRLRSTGDVPVIERSRDEEEAQNVTALERAGMLSSAKYWSAKALLSLPKQSFGTPERRELHSPALEPGAEVEMSGKEIVKDLLVGVIKTLDGELQAAPAHLLQALDPVENPAALPLSDALLALAADAQDLAAFLIRTQGEPAKEQLVKELDARYPEREQQITASFNLLELELLEQREKLQEAVFKGVPAAQSKLNACERELDDLARRKEEAKQALLAEYDAFSLSPVTIYGRALVWPTPDDADHKTRSDAIEKIAVDYVRDYETRLGAACKDVSDPMLRMGFDLLSKRPDGEERYIEVKGRALEGTVELTENEWKQAANQRGKYYLYVVYHCADHPQLYINRDPFGRLVAKPKGGVIIGAPEIMRNAQND